MKTRHILFVAFLSVLVTGGLVLGYVNQFSDTLLLTDGTDLQLGTDGDFAADFDSGNQRIRFYDADSNLLGYLSDDGATATLYIDGDVEASGSFVGGTGGNVEDLETAGAAGTVPMSDGATGLDMIDVLREDELDTEAELEAQLTDVSNVLTNNDTIAGSQIGIHATTAETANAVDDEVIIYDTSAGANRRMTWANFTTGISGSMTSFDIDDGVTSQTIENGNTITLTDGDFFDFVVSATDTITGSMDIHSASALTDSDNADEIAVYDNSGAVNRKMTRANWFLGGFAIAQDDVFTLGNFATKDDSASGDWVLTDGTNTLLAVDDLGTRGEAKLHGQSYIALEVTSVTSNTVDVAGASMLHFDCASSVDVYTLTNTTGTSKRVTIINTDAAYTVTIHDGDGNIELPGNANIVLGEQESIMLDYIATDAVNKWVLTASGSEAMTSFTLSGDGGSDQTITNGNTVEIAGGNGVATTGVATDTVSIALSALTGDWTQSGAFDVLLANASSELKIMESAGDTYYGIFDIGDLGADRTYTISADESGYIPVVTAVGTAGQVLESDGDGTYSWHTKTQWAIVLTAEGATAPSSGGAGDAAVDAYGNVTRAFDPDTDECLYWSNSFITDNWDEAAVDVTIIWRAAADWADSADKVDWEVSSIGISASDTSNEAPTGTISFTQTWATGEAVGDDLRVSNFSYTIGGSAIGYDRVKWKLNRDADDATNDTCTGDAELLLIYVAFDLD